MVTSVLASAGCRRPALVVPIATSVEFDGAERRAAFTATDKSTVATGVSAVTSMLPVSASVSAGGGCGLAEVPRLARAATARTMSDAARRRGESFSCRLSPSVVVESSGGWLAGLSPPTSEG